MLQTTGKVDREVKEEKEGMQTRNVRIMESSELEEIFKGHLVQLPSNEQGHLPLDHIAQSSTFTI